MIEQTLSVRAVDHPELDGIHNVAIGIHKVTVLRGVVLEVGVESHLVRVQHAELAWAGADADPHVAAAIVPRAREDALALGHGRSRCGACWRDEEACAAARVAGVNRASRIVPVHARVRGLLV